VNISTNHPYIAFEGVIGVGKTTLARMLQSRFSASTLLEAFDENPFLSDFYGDRARYAFQTQLFFLLNRYRQQQKVPAQLQQGALLADYFFRKDQLFAHLNVTGDELEMYDKLYAVLSETVVPPDLVVYLRAETDTLMDRIAMRDRPYERAMDRAYISALRQAYEDLFAEYEATALLVIETDGLDFVRNAEDLNDIEHRIRAALSGVRQPSFPEISRLAAAAPAISRARGPRWGDEFEAPTTPYGETNWQALGDFLALSEAVGRIGGEMGRQPPMTSDGVSPQLAAALREAARSLAVLAQRTGIRLEE
jgi:deoxyguanosine kinase